MSIESEIERNVLRDQVAESIADKREDNGAKEDPAAVHAAVKRAIADQQKQDNVELSACPCGEVPKGLVMECQEGAKFGRVAAHCCAQWYIEYFNHFEKDPNKMLLVAVKAWNSAKRAG